MNFVLVFLNYNFNYLLYFCEILVKIVFCVLLVVCFGVILLLVLLVIIVCVGV